MIPNPWVILGAVFALLGAAGGGFWYGNHNRGVSCDRDAARVQATAASELADWQAKARAAENASQAAVGRIAEAYEKGKTDAQHTEAAVIADQRAGNLKLRKQWQGCEARLSQASAAPGRSDVEADERIAAAGAVVRIGAECDAQLRGLQDYARQVSQ